MRSDEQIHHLGIDQDQYPLLQPSTASNCQEETKQAQGRFIFSLQKRPLAAILYDSLFWSPLLSPIFRS